MELESLLKIVLEKRASDLHLRVGNPPVLRIDGKLKFLDLPKLKEAETEKIAESLMSERQRRIFQERNECDLAFDYQEKVRFRTSIFRQKGKVSLALRLIPYEIPSFEELNLPPTLKKLCEAQRGIVLVTGPAGCGKSTTLASMIEYINSSRAAHIITVEDPIEFVYQTKKSIISQRELGIDTLSYAEALKHIVRQDPNVILIGEMRDLETISSALTAAQTGHLVFSTLHTIDAVQTVTRAIDLFPPYQQKQIRLQLADTLVGVVSQRLLPCKKGGRIPAVELLIATPFVRKLIEENNLEELENAMKQGGYYGMQTFNQVVLKYYQEEKITLEVALEGASNPEELLLSIRGIEEDRGIKFE